MKKLLLTLSVVGLATIVNATTTSVVVAPGQFKLLCVGPVKVSQVLVAATTATNVTANMVDCPTNTALTYINPAYTNIVSYLTNVPVIYTNYYGVVTTNADSSGNNWVLVDVANTVAQTTNSYPTVTVAAAASTTVSVDNMNQYFFRGISVTNTGSGNLTLTATYVNQ